MRNRIILLLLLVGRAAHAQNGGTLPTAEMPTAKLTTKITVDGNLNEAAWAQATTFTDFVQREPNYGAAASEVTRVFVLYDHHRLYFAAELQDREPERVIANVMRRDAKLEDNDSFEIYLDTYHDHRNLFYFATNALGAQRDGLIRNEGESQNWDWDGVWESAARRTPQGWSAEIAIPLRTLRFNTDSVQTWGVNFARRIARKREESYWAPVARDLGFFGHLKPAYYGHLTGLRQLHNGGVLEAKPFLLTGGVKDFADDKALDRKLEFGADAKVHLTANLTADLTLNTDFAQVESDQEQVNLTRFDLFFPEKREFFLENADMFRVGERVLDFEPPSTLLFFSRSIGLTDNGEAVPITAGAKVTGKLGHYELGMLDVLTNRTSYSDDNDTDEASDDKLVELPRQNFSVFRVKRDILAKSSLGFIATSKALSSDVVERAAASRALLRRTRESNSVVAADVNLAFGTGTRFTGFLGKSQTSNVHGKDWAGTAFFSHELDRWGCSLEYSAIQENFEAQLGFIQRTGVHKYRALPYLSQRWSRGPIRQTWFFNSLQFITDEQHQLETRALLHGFFNLFRNGSELFVGTLGAYDALDEAFELRDGVEVPVGAYSFRSFLGEFNSDRSKRVALIAQWNAGAFYNGNLASVGGGVLVRPNANLALELNYTRNQIDLPVPGGEYGTNLGFARIVYSFTPRLFAKVFTQYNSDDERFRFNLLVNWIHRPGSNFFLVYNEEQDTSGANWHSRNRTLLAKFNYLVGW